MSTIGSKEFKENKVMKLIDKDALVAEIGKRIKEIDEIGTYLSPKGVLTNLLCHINTLEVKEVDSIWNDARKTIPEDSSNQIICIKEDDLAVATIGKFVRGTKKWAYLNDLLNISNVQVKEMNLEKEFDKYTKDILACDVLFEPFTHLYNCAKYFFELGLTQKGE